MNVAVLGTLAARRADSGYLMGGYDPSANVTAIDKFAFSNESLAALDATINTARQGGCGVNNSTKGYCMGGKAAPTGGGDYSEISDIVFSSDTSSELAATLDTARGFAAGASSGSAGYMVGGMSGSNTRLTTISKLVFSGETEANIVAALNPGVSTSAGCSSSTKGYRMGGYKVSGGEATVATIDSLTFSDDSLAGLAATLDLARNGCGGFNSSTKGYCFGGYSGGFVSSIEDLNFSNESSAAIVETLDTAAFIPEGINSSTDGYICGGCTSLYDAATTTIQDLLFSNETLTTLAATLSGDKYGVCGVQSGMA